MRVGGGWMEENKPSINTTQTIHTREANVVQQVFASVDGAATDAIVDRLRKAADGSAFEGGLEQDFRRVATCFARHCHRGAVRQGVPV